ncbi:MAG: metalloregulator ArsR/SmtB family transcription factor [Candidatus Eremiobacteraeota bacterium]|nr:metalloregulator ArsR/SmtB family transcription factor [Candidatus Eremiobacteraeota bacterium]
MNVRCDIAAIAAAIGDRTRARILDALVSGESMTATELAYRAGVSPQTTSAHLAKLCQMRLVSLRRSGRHRYFVLASEEVASALEALAVIAPKQPVVSLRQSDEAKALKLARMCYDHLAGVIGVAITDYLQRKRYLRSGRGQFLITSSGDRWLGNFGIDLEAIKRARRKQAIQCRDWSEQVPHIGGALGAAVAQRALDLEWFKRSPQHRALAPTAEGRKALRAVFGIAL